MEVKKFWKKKQGFQKKKKKKKSQTYQEIRNVEMKKHDFRECGKGVKKVTLRDDYLRNYLLR